MEGNGHLSSHVSRPYHLQEATKRAFENWKVWENYSAVSVDVGSFQETMRAIDRIFVLKQEYNDWQVGRGR